MHYRKVKQALIKLTEADCCSVCKREMPHRGATYGGLTREGKVELVGECCRSHLTKIHMIGVYYAPPSRRPMYH
jgi:hypothetical protein